MPGMPDLGDVSWPPDPIRTDRLLLRRTEARDRDSYIDLMCSADVYRYLGGPHSRERVERDAPEVPGNRPGVFAVEADEAFLGAVTVDRRDAERPGHIAADGNELELGYLFSPTYWGRGYATEAVMVVLDWIDEVLPEEPIVLCTQTANRRPCVWQRGSASRKWSVSSSSTPSSGSAPANPEVAGRRVTLAGQQCARPWPTGGVMTRL